MKTITDDDELAAAIAGKVVAQYQPMVDYPDRGKYRDGSCYGGPVIVFTDGSVLRLGVYDYEQGPEPEYIPAEKTSE